MNRIHHQKFSLWQQKLQLKTIYLAPTDFQRNSIEHMAIELTKRIELFKNLKKKSNIILVNIGTNNIEYANFDTIGPRIGSKLIEEMRKMNIPCYGTMTSPLHAQNIKDFINQNRLELKRNLILVTDAFRGPKTTYQTIQIRNHGIYPGSGEHKHLPKIGDIVIGVQTAIFDTPETIKMQEIEQLSSTTTEIINKSFTLSRKKER